MRVIERAARARLYGLVHIVLALERRRIETNADRDVDVDGH
jgi:hypothetical protein